MDKVLQNSTNTSPFIRLSKKEGTLDIKGRIIPENPIEFWAPIISAIRSYFDHPAENTILTFNLEYFCTYSSKRILEILLLMNESYEAGHLGSVIWHLDEDDEDMQEAGKDYAFMTKVPFHFVYNQNFSEK